MPYVLGLILTASLVLSAPLACAGPAHRAERWEAYFQARWIDGEQLGLRGPATVDVSGDQAWAFGFGYNFTNQWSVSGELGWGSTGFRVDSVDENGDDVRVRGTLDTTTTYLNGTYYLLDRALTPYVSGVLGWTYIDSNIPSGPPSNVCWWDPWYGYICTSYQPTHTETAWSYGLSAGLRWDGPKGFFLRGGVGETWFDLDAADGRPSFVNWRLDIGTTF